MNLSIAAAGRHAPRAAVALLAVLLAFMGWNLLIGLHTTELPARPAVTKPRPLGGQSTDGIAKTHLFGVAESAGASQAVAPPPSSWHVIGIIVSDPPRDSLADIVIDGDEHLWRVGDQLPDGSTLAEINDGGIRTSGSKALLPFELRPASLDNRSLQTDDGNDNVIDTIAVTPTARMQTGPGLPDRMNALRAAGVAVWIKRVQQSSPQALPATSPHH